MAATLLRPRSQREAMYEVPPWRRREVARAAGPKFESRDSARLTGPRKAQARTQRRQADKALAREIS